MLQGGLRFTVLGVEKFGQLVRLEGYEHTARDSWLVVTLRVENLSDDVPTYKSRDQTLSSDGVTYKAESNMLGVDDSQWVTSDITRIPLFFDVPDGFPEDEAVLRLNLIESHSDAPPAVIRIRTSRRATDVASTVTTEATTTTEAADGTTSTVPTDSKLTEPETEGTALQDREDREFLSLVRRRAPRYDSEYLFRTYSDEDLVFLGRDFCSELTSGVTFEVLFGEPASIARFVTQPDDVSVISEGGLGVEYLTAIDTWCPERRPEFDAFVADIKRIVQNRTTTITAAATNNESLDLAVLVHPVLGAYELSDLYSVAQAVCAEFELGADWDSVALAVYTTSPADWDEETVGYFLAYSIRRHCPSYDWML